MRCIEPSSFVCRRIWHLFLSDRLPGFIGPFPPPLLIRLYAIFEVIIHAFSQMSTLFRVLFPRIAKNGITARHSRPIVNAEVPKVQYSLLARKYSEIVLTNCEKGVTIPKHIRESVGMVDKHV